MISLTPPSSKLQVALIHRMGDYLGQSVDPDSVDCAQSFFDQSGFALGNYVLDSLTLAELMLTLEEDLDIEIVGDEELGRLGCVSAVADTLTERADPASLALFEEKWAGSVSGPSAHP